MRISSKSLDALRSTAGRLQKRREGLSAIARLSCLWRFELC